MIYARIDFFNFHEKELQKRNLKEVRINKVIK